MRTLERIVPVLLLGFVATACATTRAPVTDVPPGIYVMVEPASEVYNAVAITNRAFTVRSGSDVYSGEHWIGSDGQLRMAAFSGPCAGQESIWRHSFANNRVTLNLQEDRCMARPMPFPQRMVYERR